MIMGSEKNYILNLILHNSIYAVMIILGCAIFLAGSGLTITGIVFAALYFCYGLLGSLWIIIFMCPSCVLYDNKACPCGYGVISAKIRKKGDHLHFREKFKKHIPVIVPQWLIPPSAGIMYLVQEFSVLMLVLLILFCVQAFVVLPLFSRHYGCKDCPQKEECAWMKKKKNGTEPGQEDEDTEKDDSD